ncbi:MAG: hypothetical protein JWN25_1224, partial [Verrucomicrobiales bacterium]|nr:hypothetical protein [Verrucomicrobiales bacterium]
MLASLLENNRLRFFPALFLLWFLLALPALALDRVTLQLKGGDRISGAVLSQTTNSIVLSNSWSPRLTFLLADVEKKVLLTNAPVAAVATNTTPAVPKVAIATPPSPTPNPPKAGAVPPTHPRYWHGDIALGTDLTFSTKDRQLYYGRTKLTYARDITVFHQTLKHFKNVVD